jgi:hypothetical protein
VNASYWEWAAGVLTAAAIFDAICWLLIATGVAVWWKKRRRD